MEVKEVETKKELHGWWDWPEGKRECTAERLLINPYNGCSIGCWFCYAQALPGHFETFLKEGTIFVWKNFHKDIEEQLDSIDVASCGYLSPVTDPFQPLNKKYKLSEKIIEAFISRNIPIEFITKGKVPQEVIEMLKHQKHSFGQVTILTPKENLRRILVPNGASTIELFDNLIRLSNAGIYSVCRIDPIFPYITDKKEDLIELVKKAVDAGSKHIIASILDIPKKISNKILENIRQKFGFSYEYDYKRLYTEDIGYFNAKIDYRKKIFDFLRNISDKYNITFSLCMEFEIVNGKIQGLNKEFMSSINCEGMNVPIYIRKGKRFQPIIDCFGNCLNCKDAKCGIQDLALAKSSKKSFKLSDYKRWSKEIKTPTLL